MKVSGSQNNQQGPQGRRVPAEDDARPRRLAREQGVHQEAYPEGARGAEDVGACVSHSFGFGW